MSYYIAIDIGGTQMRAALYPENVDKPDQVKRITTQSEGEDPLDRLKDLIASVWPPRSKVISIAVAVPGPVDPYTGMVRQAPNIPGWVDLPLRQLMEERFHVPVALGNDANLAGLAEWRYGSGRGHHHMIYVTVSTGIGGGIICDDRLLLGRHGLAGELGHVTVQPDGPLCGCGQRGHLEAFSSGPSIVRWVEQEMRAGKATCLDSSRPFSAKDVSLAASQGDALSIAAFQQAGYFLGIAFTNYLHIFNPSALILGGGVSRSGRLILDPMEASLREHVITPSYLDNLVIATATFGDDAGLLGALALAHTLTH